MFFHYLKVAFRNLWRYKVQNLIGIIGLAVAFLCFCICNFVVKMGYEYDSHYLVADRMYKVEPRYGSVVNCDILQVLDEFPEIEKMTSVIWDSREYYGILKDQGGKENMYYFEYLVEADSSFLDFFFLSFMAGNKYTALSTNNSLVIYESIAKKMGNPTDLIGRTITFNDEPFQITGILRDPPLNSSVSFISGLLFNRIDGRYSRKMTQWTPHYVYAYILLSEKSLQKKLQEKLDQIDFEYPEELADNREERILIHPLQSYHWSEVGTTYYLAYLFAGWLILLIAVFNAISFQSAQFYNRLRECAIRKVNGSGQMQQLWLFYSEIVIILLISCLLGFALLEAVKPLLYKYFSNQLTPQTISLFRMQIMVYFLFGLIISFLLCIIPSKIIGNLSTNRILLGISSKAGKNRGQNIILTLQLLILLTFLSIIFILKLQITEANSYILPNLSYTEREHIIQIFCDYEQLEDKKDILAEQFLLSPAVEDVMISASWLSSHNYFSVGYLDTENNEKIYADQLVVSKNFHEFLNIHILQGESFNNEPDITGVAIVDETFAALYPDSNPIGHHYKDYRIIGVTERMQMINEYAAYPQPPVFYTPLITNDTLKSYVLYVKAATGKKTEAEQHILKCIHEFIPENFDILYGPFQKELDSLLFGDEVYFSRMLPLLFAICLIISLLSIYSAVSVNTEKRYKEVAIRKINGATIWDVIRLFSKTYLGLWTFVCIVAFPVIYILGQQWLQQFKYHISLNIWFFLSIYLSILSLILLIIIFQIVKVAMTNPAEAIKRVES